MGEGVWVCMAPGGMSSVLGKVCGGLSDLGEGRH